MTILESVTIEVTEQEALIVQRLRKLRESSTPLLEVLRTQPWAITWQGHTFTDAEMTYSESVAAQTLAGAGFDSLNPWAGPVQLGSIMAAMLATRTGQPAAVILASFDEAPLDDVLGAITIRDDEG